MNQHAPTYLLDTDWVINYLIGLEVYRDKFEELGLSRIGIIIVSVAELYEGVYYSRDPRNSEQRLEKFLEGIMVMEINDDICKAFGRERGRLRQRGLMIGDFDLMIASTALHYHIPLCTSNRQHFDRIKGLEIVSIIP